VSFDSVSSSVPALLPLEVALAHLILCLYVLLRRWLDDTTGRLFMAYMILTALWNVNLAVVASNRPTLSPGFGWTQIAGYGLVVLGIVYWTFARAFLQRPWISPEGWAVGMTGLVMVVFFEMRWLALPPPLLTGGDGQVHAQTIPFVLSTGFWALFMAMTGLTAEFQQFQTRSPAHKNRINYLFIATVLLVVGYVLVLSRPESLGGVGLVVTLGANALLTYTVVVEDLVDLGTALRRATGVLAVALVTIAVYVAGIYLVQILLGDLLDSTSLGRTFGHTLVVATVTAVVLTIVYTPIRQVSQRLFDRLLLGRDYDTQAVMHDYSQAISNLLYLSDLANTALAHIGQALGVDRGALLILDSESNGQIILRVLPALGADDLPKSISLSRETPIVQRLISEDQALSQYTIDISPQFAGIPDDERQALKELKFEWLIPILKNKRLIGAFALGPRRSGQPCSARDLRLLRTLADQTALALENAALFDHLQRNLAETTRVKNLMGNVLASIVNAVITIDIDGKITLLNHAAESILGVPSERCLGREYTEALPFLADTALPVLITNIVDQEAPYYDQEIAAELPERGQVNLSVNLTAIKNARGEAKGVAIVIDDLTETKRLRAVHDMFRRYVSPAVVDRLPTDPDDLRLGGHRQEVTILFADICDFTAFSERLAPEALVDILNQYLSMAAAAILIYEGTLDKFMGDALMGIFNAPLKQEDHVLRAVRAAAAMQRAVSDLHHHISEKHRLNFAVGIHVGEVVMGNVGMPDRMDYTAIGDAVNVAKRIQEKAPAGKVLISEAVYHVVKNSADAIYYAEMQVKGRTRPVRAYELRWV
jgi:adenylate cyclase